MSKIIWALFILAILLGLAAVWVTPATLDTKLAGSGLIALLAAGILLVRMGLRDV